MRAKPFIHDAGRFDIASEPRADLRRATIVRGLAAADAAELDTEGDGGKYGGGIIPGFAVVTRGEALGHGVWLDQEFVDSIRGYLEAERSGVKARFTHPDMSADGLGRKLGRADSGRLDREGDLLRADLHLYKSAHKTPEGDLAEYTLSLAAEDPGSFGASIVYQIDLDAEREFFEAHGGEVVEEDEGFLVWINDNFTSPDELNVDNLPHARAAGLLAVDIVDDPAANPDGLFSRTRNPAIVDADRLLRFATGLDAEQPTMQALSVSPARARVFFDKWLTRHNLALVSRESTMSTEHPPADPVDDKPADTPADPVDDKPTDDDTPEGDDKPAESLPSSGESSTPSESSPSDDSPAEQLRAELGRFCEAFGRDNGSKWFEQGLSFAAAMEQHARALAEENGRLRKRLEAAGQEEGEPVSAGDAPEPGKEPQTFGDLFRMRSRASRAAASN